MRFFSHYLPQNKTGKMYQLHSVLLNNFLETVVRICREHKQKQRSGHSHKEWYKSYCVADIWTWIFPCWHSTGELKSLGHLKLSISTILCAYLSAYLLFYVKYKTCVLGLHNIHLKLILRIPFQGETISSLFVLCCRKGSWRRTAKISRRNLNSCSSRKELHFPLLYTL